jgi:uncharacterized membrane protein YoaK (UPF0700 family)
MQRSVDYVRTLTAQARSARANRHLGYALAGVAGAMNAGGFLAVQQYTSHMTGIVSSAADNLALGAFDLVLDALGAIVSFLLGAATTALLVNYGRRRALASEYALPLLCGLLGSFFCGGVAGALGFKILGYVATVPLALLLCGLAIVPALDDLRARARRR